MVNVHVLITKIKLIGYCLIITTKGVPIRQEISLDVEWIQWPNEQGLMNYTHIL
jgi:hypothetical protein